MSNITGLTRGGTPWTPEFVVSLDPKTCIGCGRCYKICPRDVLTLQDRDDDDEDFDDDDPDNCSVMIIKNAADCIGCGACGRTCPKNCYTFAAAPAGA